MITHNPANLSAIPRVDGGRFAKGGPGRPKGARSKLSKLYLSELKEMGPTAIQKVRDALNAGEWKAVELIIWLIIPRERTIELEDATVDDAKEALKSGDVSIAEFQQLLSGLQKAAELSELAELKERLTELERSVRDEDS